MNKFTWGNLNHPGYYLENAVSDNTAGVMRNTHSMLAGSLAAEGQNSKALQILDKAVKEIPNYNLPFDRRDLALANSYCEAGNKQKGEEVYTKIFDYYLGYYNYYKQFKGKKARSIESDRQFTLQIMSQLLAEAQNHGVTSLQQRKALVPELAALDNLQQARQMYNGIVNDINSAAALARSDKKVEATNAFNASLDKVLEMLQLSDNNEELLQRTQQLIGFIFQNAQQHQLKSVSDKLQANPTLKNIVQSVSMQQQQQ
jgi:tetratricopeptide (TPR) repeat protein